MQDMTNIIQKTSYCNKDFVAVYTELLDLVKALTNKWVPELSNESDPGVILLKLNALIADKVNYNVDTNILETFPISVTQQPNARALFEQLGYYPHWYIAATTDVSIKWTDGVASDSTEAAVYYTIPAFSTVCDSSAEIIYTLIGPSENVADGEFIVGDQKVYKTGATISFRAIQGVPTNYTYNGSTLITYDMLDSERRLYFPSTDIAENGIFITNSQMDNYSSWEKKDNLLIETLDENNRYYRLGISQDNMSCYLEFPENVETLFGEGVYITYIRTSGEGGNVSARLLDNMYNNVTPAEDSSVTLSANNLTIANYVLGGGGRDPESINDAYKNYKSTVGTFKTLITLRDYIGYILESGLVSNGFVCDRTNDIQSTYKVMTEEDELSVQNTIIEQAPVTRTGDITVNGVTYDDAVYTRDEDELTAFSLKFYLLQYSNTVDTLAQYNTTYTMLTNTENIPIQAYVDEAKVISHDYVDIVPATTSKAHFCMFKNRYPIVVRIIPQKTLTKTEKSEVKQNVIKALHNGLNSQQIEFGEEISSDVVYDMILAADGRIKNIMLDNFEYTTYATYFDGSNYQEIIVSKEDDAFEFINTSTSAVITSVTAATYYVGCGSTSDYTYHTFKYTSGGSWDEINSEGTATGKTASDFGIDISAGTLNDTFSIRLSTNNQFRYEIYTKSVLAGATQFLVKDEAYDYRLNQCLQSANDIFTNITHVKSNVDITVSNTSPSYTLREHESLRLYAPNFVNGVTYSNYTKFEYYITRTFYSNTDYVLQPNEWILLYWKNDSSSDAIYQYAGYGEGAIIRLEGLQLEAQTQSYSVTGTTLINLILNSTSDPKKISTELNGSLPYALSNSVDTITKSAQILSSTKTITAREINSIDINSADYYCYWTLNDYSDGQYTLFNSGDTSRVLDIGEYFFYTNKSLTNMAILGSGTKIERSAGDTSKWSVDMVDVSEILEEGASVLSNYWFKIPTNNPATITENQFVTIPSGYEFKLDVSDLNLYSLKFDGGTTTRIRIYDPTTSTGQDLVAIIDGTDPGTEDIYINSSVFFSKFTNTNSFNVQDDSPAAIFTWSATEEKWQYGGESISMADYGIVVYDTTEVTSHKHAGSTITIKINTDWSETFKSDSDQAVDLTGYDLYYRLANTTEWTELSGIDLGTGNGWQGISILSLATSKTQSQPLLTNQSVTLTVFDTTQETSSETTVLGQNLTDVYRCTTDQAYAQNTKGQITILGQSYYFNFTIASGTNDVLEFNPAVDTTTGHRFRLFRRAGDTAAGITAQTWYDLDELTTAPTSPTLFTMREELIYPVSILVSSDLNVSATGNTTVYTENDNLELEYMSVYKFEELASILDNNMSINTDYAFNLTVPAGSGTQSYWIRFSLPVGTYLIPVSIPVVNSTGTVVRLWDDTGYSTLHPIYDSTINSLKEKKTYYLKLEISNLKQYLLIITAPKQTASSYTIKVRNPYKWTYPDNLTSLDSTLTQEEIAAKVLTLLSGWDINHDFDYTHETDDDDNVYDPLSAKAFFDNKHIFNPFTIAMLNTSAESNTDITFTK